MKDDELILVKNRSNGSVGYTLPELNVNRFFAFGESKKIPLNELRQLQYADGGEYLLKNCLIVENVSALDALNMQVEPEYFYDEKKIREILLESDNMDEFLDFLDFATEGAIAIAKKIAVEEQIPDSRKRKAISKKTGFNIDKAIEINEVLNAEDEKKDEKEEIKERRVKEDAADATPKRRTAVPAVEIPSEKPRYNVITKK